MYNEKKERNALIVKLVDKKKKSLSEIAEQFNLKSKSTVHAIYHREKFGVRRWQKEKELSTG